MSYRHASYKKNVETSKFNFAVLFQFLIHADKNPVTVYWMLSIKCISKVISGIDGRGEEKSLKRRDGKS